MILSASTLSHYSEWHQSIASEGGVVLIDKASGWTSFDVIAKLRGITSIRKVGHAGTLDPLVTGLLIVCLGKATTTILTYQDAVKRYEAIVRFGARTKTDDAEGEEEDICDVSGLKADQVEAQLDNFRGAIEQIPPMFSAIKKNGVRLYKLARKGVDVERAARSVTVHSLDLLKYNSPHATLDILCSKGTYIRSLARDLGDKLECGAYLSGLRRSAIGDYSVDEALSLEQINEAASKAVD